MELVGLGLKIRPTQHPTIWILKWPLRLRVPHSTTLGSKIFRIKKILEESSRRHGSHLLCVGNYSHCVYVVVTTDYVAFTLCEIIKLSRDDLKVHGKVS